MRQITDRVSTHGDKLISLFSSIKFMIKKHQECIITKIKILSTVEIRITNYSGVLMVNVSDHHIIC